MYKYKKNKENMVQNYILKRTLIYDILNCPSNVFIPTNDYEAWIRPENKDFLWLYNKLMICQSQNIHCAPLGVMPLQTDFPIIVKPIINLYGMGFHAYKVKSLDEFKENKILQLPGMFWSSYLNGKHISLDVFMIKGKIKWFCAFRGHKDKKKFGAFLFWETVLNYRMSFNIKVWIKKHLGRYTGCLNLEIIGKDIIEVHLRMGDINHLDLYDEHSNLIMKTLIDIYKGKKSKHINSLTHFFIPKIYIIPLFLTKDEYQRRNKLTPNELHTICEYYNIKMLQIDPSPSNVSNPVGGIRICSLTTNNIMLGQAAKTEIREKLLKPSFFSFLFSS